MSTQTWVSKVVICSKPLLKGNTNGQSVGWLNPGACQGHVKGQEAAQQVKGLATKPVDLRVLFF